MVVIEKDRVRKAIQELKRLYERLSFESLVWKRDGDKRDPYRALIVMGLSQQTSDDNGLRVWTKFLSLYPTATDLIKAWHRSQDSVLSIVKPLGNHGRLRQILEAAVDFGIAIPSEASDVQRPGIAETTAEKVVGYGYGKAALPLDSHGCRVVSRICNLKFSLPSAVWP
jgi:endonuclease III